MNNPLFYWLWLFLFCMCIWTQSLKLRSISLLLTRYIFWTAIHLVHCYNSWKNTTGLDLSYHHCPLPLVWSNEVLNFISKFFASTPLRHWCFILSCWSIFISCRACADSLFPAKLARAFLQYYEKDSTTVSRGAVEVSCCSWVLFVLRACIFSFFFMHFHSR